MPLSANPSARTALTYITTGALVDIWAGVWWYYMHNQGAGEIDRTWWYVDIGLLLSGAILILIGLTIGRIGNLMGALKVEFPGTQNQRFDHAEFAEQFRQQFGYAL